MEPNGKKILLVDDDTFLLSVYAAKFKEEGYDVRTAGDGEEAWDTIENGHVPDVLFTGIVMPRMTGFELIEKMQADPKLSAIPVAISSHHGREEDKKKAKAMNVDDFIIRGTVPLVEVVRRINRLLGLEQKKYRLELKRKDLDSEELINLLNKEQQTFIGLQVTKKVYLELEPKAERGEFKVSLTSD